MQRPSTRLIKQHNLVQKFKDLKIYTIFNLEQPGEHPHCGDGIEGPDGFSYRPSDFMDEGISFMQFGWDDMTAPVLEMMLNICQVMDYMLKDGKRLAVHCHAGLGRTGLSIACYLIYGKAMASGDAIKLVRC
jgi:protein tyrosine/serine phosphatase